jgi:lipopolysaccharide biosynthesis regulator YciM
MDTGTHTAMTVYLPMLVALVALLAGLAIGKAWERYKLRDGQWIDRRKARESPHFIVGLDLVVANQIDQAIDELSRAAWLDEDALEIHLVLGNLYREKGQVGRAINIHQGLLQRQHLKTLEHAYILLCLGLDFRRGGFVDRAHEAFKEVLRLDPKNRHALIQLEKLHEEQHQWAEAYDIRQQLSEIDAAGPLRTRDNAILAFLEHELGAEASKAGDRAEAARRFAAAIERDQAAAPAYLSLGDVKLHDGDVAGAIAAWEDLIEASPDRAYLAFDRLQAAYTTQGTPQRFPDLCRRLIAANSQDWRARLALARHRSAAGDAGTALELLFEALSHNPHALLIHQEIWQALSALGRNPQLIERYLGLTRDAVFYVDPHVCVRCRYRSTELLWQCPQCHEWNTFIEERIAPAKDDQQLSA